MADPLTHLQQRIQGNWLIGDSDTLSEQFISLAERRIQELRQVTSSGTPPLILLTEVDPIKFLANFIAACVMNCPIFLGNPNWVRAEWQQVGNLVQPDLIWGDRILIELTIGQEEGYLNEGSNGRSQPLPYSKNRSWIMIPTGGSSGQIRFAIHTWDTLTASVYGFQQHFQTEQINSCCVLPFYHVSGLMQFLRSFLSGGELLILPFKTLEADSRLSSSKAVLSQIDPANFFLSLVPTQLQRLLQNAHPQWLAQFQTILLGGAPAWRELLDQARQQQIPLALTYGMTETAAQIAALKPEAFLQGGDNCGQTLPHAQVTIHGEKGEGCDRYQVGTVNIRANSLALGYYPDLFVNQLFQTDDLGFIDDQDQLHIVGRNSQKIITGGENVFPTEVEAAIRLTNLVADICVIGLPDRQWGEVVTAIYVPKPNISESDWAESVADQAIALQAALTQKLSNFKRPKHLIAVEQLPRNQQGKLNYEQLKKLAWDAIVKPIENR
jgi:o-succinylbenzoate---CoA ligase